jgi:hypothetical protein
MTSCAGGWTPAIGEYPFPPANATVIHSFTEGCLDLRWDDPSTLNTGPTLTPVQAAGTVLVSGNPIPNTTATADVTVNATPIAAGETLTINGVALTSVAAARSPGNNDFNGTLGSTTLLAAEIANALNDNNNTFRTTSTASSSGAVVTLTSVAEGAAGNALTLASSTVGITAPATFSGGVDADTLTFAGMIALSAVTGVRTAGGQDFSADGSNFDVADDIAAAINDTDNGLSAYLTATSDAGLVTLAAVPVGTAGNSIAMETTSTVLTLSGATLSGGTGTVSCDGRSNTSWTITGVNVYRSDTGERGPYFRVNHIPVGGVFYRDCTSNILREDELVDWALGWGSRGDAANNRLWRIKTRRKPIVKDDGQAIAADSPTDVSVTIDGVPAVVNAVSGVTGEIDLVNQRTYDPSTEQFVEATLPAADGTSVVLVTYRHQGNLVKTDLDTKAKIHYRLTTVAVDPSGTTPSGLVETPLGYSEPVSPIHTEKLDYIWTEAIRRNRWILEQGGERVKLFIRRVTGIPCTCQWDLRLFEFSQQPLNNCTLCYGTGFLGGFEGPTDVIVAPDDSESRITQTVAGRVRQHQYEVWTGPSPLLSQRDFLVKQNGERFSIGPVRRTQVRGVVLQQAFNIGYLEENDIRYRVPMVGLTDLPWPETRYTRPQDAECVDSDPYPVGYDADGAPMGTEVAKIPDGREQRGRTPVWANLTYGGKGT